MEVDVPAPQEKKWKIHPRYGGSDIKILHNDVVYLLPKDLAVSSSVLWKAALEGDLSCNLITVPIRLNAKSVEFILDKIRTPDLSFPKKVPMLMELWKTSETIRTDGVSNMIIDEIIEYVEWRQNESECDGSFQRSQARCEWIFKLTAMAYAFKCSKIWVPCFMDIVKSSETFLSIHHSDHKNLEYVVVLPPVLLSHFSIAMAHLSYYQYLNKGERCNCHSCRLALQGKMPPSKEEGKDKRAT